MQQWDILSELESRIKQDTAGAWARVQTYYQQIGQSSVLEGLDYLDGETLFDDSDYGITLQDFTYSTPDIVKTPIVVDSRTFQNDLDISEQQEFTFDKELAETFTLSFTKGLSVGAKATAKVGLPLLGQSEVELSTQITFQAEQQLSKTETHRWTLRTPVEIPPRTTVKVTGFITNAQIRATFSGIAKATKGTVLTWFKLKGDRGWTEFRVPLVVLLPEGQRVFPISGNFEGVEGISTYTRVEKI